MAHKITVSINGGYPNSWKVWKIHGKITGKMDGLGVPPWLWKPPWGLQASVALTATPVARLSPRALSRLEPRRQQAGHVRTIWWEGIGNYGELWEILRNFEEFWGIMGNYGELLGDIGICLDMLILARSLCRANNVRYRDLGSTADLHIPMLYVWMDMDGCGMVGDLGGVWPAFRTNHIQSWRGDRIWLWGIDLQIATNSTPFGVFNMTSPNILWGLRKNDNQQTWVLCTVHNQQQNGYAG